MIQIVKMVSQELQLTVYIISLQQLQANKYLIERGGPGYAYVTPTWVISASPKRFKLFRKTKFNIHLYETNSKVSLK